MYAGEESYISRGLGKKFLPKPNLPSPSPPPKSQMVVPYDGARVSVYQLDKNLNDQFI